VRGCDVALCFPLRGGPLCAGPGEAWLGPTESRARGAMWVDLPLTGACPMNYLSIDMESVIAHM